MRTFLLSLPAYSSDLNSIEIMWAKVKQHLRSARARSQRSLLAASDKLWLPFLPLMPRASFVMPVICAIQVKMIQWW